jgi:nicotinate-nucleotide adenylyltransferase
MLREAIAGDDFFDILTDELERPAPSYTYDTVEHLFAKGWTEVRWMIGADQLPALPKWHRPDELVQRVRFIVARRPGFPIDWEKLPSICQRLRKSVVDIPQIDLSATLIRERIRAGKSIRYLVPPSVEAYILRHGLYR